MAEKTYGIEIDIKKVSSVNISRYADGYNYASISQKVSDNEYMSIHYEWKGNTIPEFAMNAMDIMKALGMEKARVIEDCEVAHLERASRYTAELAAKFKKKDSTDDEDIDNK